MLQRAGWRSRTWAVGSRAGKLGQCSSPPRSRSPAEMEKAPGDVLSSGTWCPCGASLQRAEMETNSEASIGMREQKRGRRLPCLLTGMGMTGGCRKPWKQLRKGQRQDGCPLIVIVSHSCQCGEMPWGKTSPSRHCRHLGQGQPVCVCPSASVLVSNPQMPGTVPLPAMTTIDAPRHCSRSPGGAAEPRHYRILI